MKILKSGISILIKQMMPTFLIGATWGIVVLSIFLCFTFTGDLSFKIAQESLNATSFQMYILFYCFGILCSGLAAVGMKFLSRFEFLSKRVLSPFLTGVILGAVFITIFLMTPSGLFMFSMGHDAPSSKTSEILMLFYGSTMLFTGFAAIIIKELYRLVTILFYKAVLFLNSIL